MKNDPFGIGNPRQRELDYYRRECNDLGARLLRLQEEQSLAFREARRSRTVVRMVREAYRLADPTQTAQDVGGALLQIVVENALCERAALLREEPVGSGRFLVTNAIGGPTAAAEDAVIIAGPPAFYLTNSGRLNTPPAGLLDVLHLPYVLWVYDRSSGHALAVGNRSEDNISRSFEPGDQELIEAALFVYLDVLYRKHAEAQLRQSKQAAEEASRAQAAFLANLSKQLRPPVERILDISTTLECSLEVDSKLSALQAIMAQLIESSRKLLGVTNDALKLAEPNTQSSLLDVQWIDASDALRRVYRSSYATSIKAGVDLDITLPRRRVSICVDRDSLHRAVQILVTASVAHASSGSTVNLSADRRSDGALEVVVSSPSALNANDGVALADQLQTVGFLYGPGTDRLGAARRIVEAHQGVLVTEARSGGGSQARIILPVHMARDEEHSR